MLEPQPDDVEETVCRSCGEVTAITVVAVVAVAMTAFWLGCLIAGVSIIIAIFPALATSTWAVLMVFLCIKKLRAASRIGGIGNREMLMNGSDDVGENRMVQPPMLVPIIPSSSSSSDGGVRAGGNVASAVDVQVGGESHHRRSEKNREVEMSGKVVSDGRGKNA